jgi:hypothetical protein
MLEFRCTSRKIAAPKMESITFTESYLSLLKPPVAGNGQEWSQLTANDRCFVYTSVLRE